MNKTKISAIIPAHSINEQGDELISVLATFPRIILAEVNTHRMLSKNTSSSRAIPFKKMVESVKNDPFIPIAWQKEHKGMQGSEYITEEVFVKECIANWLEARNNAINQAEYLNKTCQVTKQLCNRLLEPFMWTTMLITGSKEGWDNFFTLRCPDYQMMSSYGVQHYKSKKDFLKFVGLPDTVENYQNWNDVDWLKVNKGQTEIHMMAFAEAVWDSVNESTPKQLIANQWHVPFRDKMDETLIEKIYHPKSEGIDELLAAIKKREESVIKISVALSARTSYTVVGEEKEVNYEAMIGLHDRLLAQDPPHSSPLEHCARAMTMDEYRGNIKGKINLINDREFQTKFSAMTGYTPLSGACEEKALGWCNNFKGFIPYRYMVDNGQL